MYQVSVRKTDASTLARPCLPPRRSYDDSRRSYVMHQLSRLVPAHIPSLAWCAHIKRASGNAHATVVVYPLEV